jgi:ADP-heptose:LPS heptosyltransferase
MTTPAVRCLKLQKNVEIHFLTKRVFTHIIDANPYIDKIIAFDKEDKEIVKKLKAENYDYVVDLHNNIRSSRIRRKLKKPFSKLYKLSIHKEVLIHTGISNLPELHVAHRMIDALKEFEVEDDEKGMDFFIHKETENKLENAPKSFIALSLGTTHFTKNIPDKTLEFIIENAPHEVVLLGGPKEKALGESLEKSCAGRCVNMAGKTNIQESALLISNAQYFIGGDTGMLHIACALKKPTLSIWGATIPEFGVYPYYGKEEVTHFIHEVALKCRPCSKHGSAKCPKKHFNCMQLQDLEKIAVHMKELA